MTCDIFIRSYWKDFDWLELCLASISRYCRGFRSVIVVVPRSSQSWLARRPALAEGVRLELCADYRDDYLGQQVTKLHADGLTDADYICHVDSDCIFHRPTAPADLIPDGRPRIARRPYASLGRHWPWRRPTEEFLGWPVTHDFMQCPPFTFPRWLYAEVREHAVAAHGVSLERYVLSRSSRGFSEFNVLAAFASAVHPDRFVWIDASAGAPACRWFWSWGGLDEATRQEVMAILDASRAGNGIAG